MTAGTARTPPAWGVALARVVSVARAHPFYVIFVAAMLPRLTFLFELHAASPTFDTPEGIDSTFYDRVAAGALPLRAFFYSPLYTFFLKTLYCAVGRDLFAARLVQHLAGALACVLVAQVALGVFRSRSVSLAAGLLAASLGPVVFYEGQVAVDALMPLGVMATLSLALRAWRRGDLLSYGLLGASIGLTALGRPVILVWVPFLLAWTRQPRPTRWARSVALLLGVLGATLPATVHNARSERGFVFITSSGGLNLYVGNHESANGAYVAPEGVFFRRGGDGDDDDGDGRRVAEDAVGRELTSAEVSAWWASRAWDLVAAHPGRAVALAFDKAELTIADAEVPQLHDIRVYREVAPVLSVLPSAGVVVVPGLAGLVVLYVARERRPVARRCAVLSMAFAASFLPFFVVGRYRSPWLLLLAPFAASFLLRVVAAWSRKDWRVLRAYTVLVGAAAALSAWPVELPRMTYQYMAFAHASMDHGDRASAARWCERALARDPASFDAVALLGRVRRQEGRFDDAEDVLAASVSRDPSNAAGWLELGRVEIETGRLDAAIASFSASVDADPRSTDAWSALAGALRKAGREAEAAHAERSLNRLEASVRPRR
jgi:4-amino-4-deoxy-L-arabinose transferase-like glycosyltransferase